MGDLQGMIFLIWHGGMLKKFCVHHSCCENRRFISAPCSQHSRNELRMASTVFTTAMVSSGEIGCTGLNPHSIGSFFFLYKK